MEILRSIHISAPPEKPTQTITGCVQVDDISNSKEVVLVAVGINKRLSPRNSEEWKSVLATKAPLQRNKSVFTLNVDQLNKNGLLWVIPTSIFEPTKVRIQLSANETLEAGFRVEIFARNTIINRDVPAAADLKTGTTVKFEIGWTLLNDTQKATPTVAGTI